MVTSTQDLTEPLPSAANAAYVEGLYEDYLRNPGVGARGLAAVFWGLGGQRTAFPETAIWPVVPPFEPLQPADGPARPWAEPPG